MRAKRKRQPSVRSTSLIASSGPKGNHLGWFLNHHPGELARRDWLFVFGVGFATWPSGYEQGKQDQDGYLLHHLVRGRLHYEVRRHPFTGSAGENCLIDMSEEHSYRAEGTGKTDFYWLWFGGEHMTRTFLQLHADVSPVSRSVDAKRVRAIWRELIDLIRRKPAAYEVQASGLITLLLADLYAARQELTPLATETLRRESYSEPVRIALDYMAAHSFAPTWVKHLAAKAGLSKYHFSRVFHHEVGMSPMVYLNRLRIDRAKSLLEQTQHPISQIGRMVGLRDQNYLPRSSASSPVGCPASIENSIPPVYHGPERSCAARSF